MVEQVKVRSNQKYAAAPHTKSMPGMLDLAQSVRTTTNTLDAGQKDFQPVGHSGEEQKEVAEGFKPEALDLGDAAGKKAAQDSA